MPGYMFGGRVGFEAHLAKEERFVNFRNLETLEELQTAKQLIGTKAARWSGQRHSL